MWLLWSRTPHIWYQNVGFEFWYDENRVYEQGFLRAFSYFLAPFPETKRITYKTLWHSVWQMSQINKTIQPTMAALHKKHLSKDQMRKSHCQAMPIISFRWNVSTKRENMCVDCHLSTEAHMPMSETSLYLLLTHDFYLWLSIKCLFPPFKSTQEWKI